jgi:leader peptidase (prepilin peptidase)/N-methyltransferase
VPLISWIGLRGRCRNCRAGIGLRQPLVELAAATWGTLALALSPDEAGVAGALFGWQMLALSLFDLEMGRLPHRLSALLAITGLASGVLDAVPAMADRIWGGVAGLVALMVIGWGYQRTRGRAGLGGGDAPLLGGIGCWLGWQALPLCLLVASLSGIVMALGFKMAGRSVGAHTKLPFGPMLSLGALCLWLAAHQG